MIIRKVVYGCEGNENLHHGVWLDWMKNDKNICFNWPFHNLFEFCGFAMTDILKSRNLIS